MYTVHIALAVHSSMSAAPESFLHFSKEITFSQIYFVSRQ